MSVFLQVCLHVNVGFACMCEWERDLIVSHKYTVPAYSTRHHFIPYCWFRALHQTIKAPTGVPCKIKATVKCGLLVSEEYKADWVSVLEWSIYMVALRIDLLQTPCIQYMEVAGSPWLELSQIKSFVIMISATMTWSQCCWDDDYGNDTV